MPSADRRFDVLMVTDCRFPGGTSSSVVEEIQAQARAGYRTGLLHLPSTVLTYPRPFNPKLRRCIERGLVALVTGPQPIETRLLLARHPTVFTDPPVTMPTVRADAKVLAVNQVPIDDRSPRPYYDVGQVEATLERLFGGEFLWGPIGPRVRDVLEETGGADRVGLSPWDWENVIDVAMWEYDRAGFVGSRPVIGRHSRGHWTKWPDTDVDVIAAYPDDPAYEVRILGGTKAPRRLLGRMPSNWIDHPFNSIPATEYLRLIDFCVYYHHPGLIEAFGRVPLEAMAAGAVCILPSYFQRLFGDVCLYGPPQDVRGHVDQLFRDWDAYAERSLRGAELARQRFSYETHIRRVSELIGPPSADQASPTPGGGPPAGIERPGRLLLLVDAVGPGQDDVRAAVVETAVEVQDAVAVALVPDTTSEPTRRAGAVVEAVPWDQLEQLPPGQRRDELRRRIDLVAQTVRPGLVVVAAPTSALATDLAAAAGADRPSVIIAPGGRVASPVGDDLTDTTTRALALALPPGWSAHRSPPVRDAPEKASGPDDLDGMQQVRRRVGDLAPGLRTAVWAARRLRRRTLAVLRRLERRARDRLGPAYLWLRDRRARSRAGHGSRAVSVLTSAARPVLPTPLGDVATHPEPWKLPVVLVTVTDDHVPPGILEVVAETQQITSSFRAVMLVPAGWETATTSYGYATETVVTMDTWSRLGRPDDWGDYIRHKLEHVRRTYRPDAVFAVTATSMGTATAAALAAQLAALGEPREDEG